MSYILTKKESSNSFFVSRSQLNGRIDPLFYNSDLSRFNSGKFPSISLGSIIKSIKSGFGAGKQDQDLNGEGIIQIRPTNITEDGFLKFEKNVYLPFNGKYELLEIGDVLFNNTNSQDLVGKTAILKENLHLTFSNHITVIKVRNEIVYPEYLWILLNMYQKNRIFYSICTNWNNQSGVGIELLKSLKIPLPDLKFQREIITIYQNAYTQKQQKDAEGKLLLTSLDSYLLNELGIILPEKDDSVRNRIFTTSYQAISGERLDPLFHNSDLSLFGTGRYCMQPLHTVIKYFKSGVGAGKQDQALDGNGIIQIRPTNIDENGGLIFKRNVYLPASFVSDKLKFDDVLFNNTNSQELVGKTAIVKTNEILSFSNHITVLRVDRDKILPDYLWLILNSFQRHKIFYSICTNWNNQSGVGLDVLKKLQIPLPTIEQQQQIVEHLNKVRSQAMQLKDEAFAIIADIQHVIEAKLLRNY